MYTLTVFIPPSRPIRKTVDIGPSFADKKGRILLSVPFKPQSPSRRNYTVSATQLAIPDSARAEFQKAQDFLEKRDTERAIACLKRAVEFAPQFAGGWNALGTIAYQSEQLEEAEVYFRRAVDLSPTYYGALVNLGGILVSQGKVEESLEVFLRAVQLRPDDPMGQARLGLTYLNLGDLDKAQERFMEAKRIEPGHFSLPQLYLAQIFGRRGARAAAIRELEEFLQIHPDSDRASDVRKTIDMLRQP
jgi:tetratricopeptide (TPR) repeat protein